MTVGFGLTGAWARHGLVVDGRREEDPCDVLWLQTPDWYADIRLPLPQAGPVEGPVSLFARPWAFAGVASWDPPTMTWEHRFDSRTRSAADANPLVKSGDLLVETGWVRFGTRRVRFVEEWRRVGSPRDRVSATVGSDGVEVTVGRRRIVVRDHRPAGDFTAVRQERTSEGWTEVGRVRAAARRPAVAAAP